MSSLSEDRESACYVRVDSAPISATPPAPAMAIEPDVPFTPSSSSAPATPSASAMLPTPFAPSTNVVPPTPATPSQPGCKLVRFKHASDDSTNRKPKLQRCETPYSLGDDTALRKTLREEGVIVPPKSTPQQPIWPATDDVEKPDNPM